MNPVLEAIGHIIDCKEATRFVSRAEDARLSAWERWRLDMHLKVCERCSRFVRQLAFMREALRRWGS